MVIPVFPTARFVNFELFFHQEIYLQITNPFRYIQTGIKTAHSKNFRQLLYWEHPQKIRKVDKIFRKFNRSDQHAF